MQEVWAQRLEMVLVLGSNAGSANSRVDRSFLSQNLKKKIINLVIINDILRLR